MKKIIKGSVRHTFWSCSAIFGFIYLFTAAATAQGQTNEWLNFQVETDDRLVLSSVANSDPEEKNHAVGDLNNDGWPDMVVVRKQPFSSQTQPAKTDLLLINENGVLVDRTAELAPGFLSTPTFARYVIVHDMDGDGWEDVIVANTFQQQPLYYRNLGNDAQGNWLGLADESSTRFPVLNDDIILFCAVYAGDVTGNGHPDLYFVNYKQGNGTALDFLLINDGTGHFTNESQARLGNLRNSAFGTSVEMADMDGDGDLDIVKVTTLYSVPPWNSQGVIVLFNNGTGNFNSWQNVAPFSPYMATIGDFDGNGFNDIFVVDDAADYVIRVSGAVPDVSLTTTREFIVNGGGGFGGNVHAADLDLDGDLDIIVSDVDVDIPPCSSGRRIQILQNNGGVFTQMYNTGFFAWSTNSYDVGILDINGDGLPDFVNGKCAGYDVVMNNTCELAPNSSDYDGDGLPDACDPCPTNPDPNCAPPTDFPVVSTELPIPRQWNEYLLASIRRDFARPPIHARNLYHTSVAMWDVWATYYGGCTYLLGQNRDGFFSNFTPFAINGDVEAQFEEALSFAMYRILNHRFANSPQYFLLQQGYDEHMALLGYDPSFTGTDYSNGDPAAFGNYVAEQIIMYGLQDGSNEVLDYENMVYEPVNPPLSVQDPGNPGVIDINRWQPLTLQIFIDQSGNVVPGATPPFLAPEWGQVYNYCLSDDDLSTYERDEYDWKVFYDPGAPPYHSMDGSGTFSLFEWTFITTLIWSAHLDPNDGVMWDISPGGTGNNDQILTSFEQHPGYYNLFDGSIPYPGHPVNPATGMAYPQNIVPRGDYTRVLAEFWADGPDSETPPGHWYSIFNKVSEHPLLERRIAGEGDEVEPSEWLVKGYLALGGAMHDVAVSAWGVKGWYDYTRPISALRAMGDLGQSTDPDLPRYHPGGLPLIPGYVELVQPGDPLAGPANVNVNKIKVMAWKGHASINNVDTDVAGVDWILVERWVPYQRSSFVTPPFAGYVSGHSTFSRAAAEVLTSFTGDAYFPGGVGEFFAPANEFLVFENGPSVDLTLQWATYRDAANESALSRIWGGIHPPADDMPGRMIGAMCGLDAFNQSMQLFDDCGQEPGDACEEAPDGLQASVLSHGVVLNWNVSPGVVGCRVFGRRIGSPGAKTINIPLSGANQLYVPNSQLLPNSTYEWRVACACQLSPLIATPFSEWSTFTLPAALVSLNSGADVTGEELSAAELNINVYPNPAKDFLQVYTNSAEQYQLDIYDISGRRMQQQIGLSGPQQQLNISDLSAGSYVLQMRSEHQVLSRHFIVN